MNLIYFLFVGTTEIFIILIGVILFVIPLGLIIASVTDILKRDFSDKSTDLILIILLLLCVPFVGSIIYFLLLRHNYTLKK